MKLYRFRRTVNLAATCSCQVLRWQLSGLVHALPFVAIAHPQANVSTTDDNDNEQTYKPQLTTSSVGLIQAI